jgi:hypothetical protein
LTDNGGDQSRNSDLSLATRRDTSRQDASTVAIDDDDVMVLLASIDAGPRLLDPLHAFSLTRWKGCPSTCSASIPYAVVRSQISISGQDVTEHRVATHAEP